MRDDFRIARVAGVDIGVHWTWLVTSVLVVWVLAASVFPGSNPGLADSTYAVMAVCAALLFFVSLLLHELGHAVQARREDVEIDGITLWLFGGVARLNGQMPSPGAEFRIALAGPAVTLAIAASMIALGAAVSMPAPVDGVIAWLGYINGSLLVFNLLPAFPLDGGRALRAALWARSDLPTATQRALGVARVLSMLMVSWGVVLVLGGGVASGLWLALIGWFLLAAGRAEGEAVTTRTRLSGVQVADLMEADPVSIAPDLPLEVFVDEVAWVHRHPTYPVVEDGRPAGLLAFHALAAVPRAEWAVHTVADCMVPLDRIPVVAATDAATDALALLTHAPLRRALVVDHDRLVGLLTLSDLVRALDVGPPHRTPQQPRTRTTVATRGL